MPPGGGLITIAVLLAMLPVAAAADVLRLFAAQRARPLPQRNLVRASWGGFFLILIGLIAHTFRLTYPFNEIALGAGAVALLYFVVGAFNCRGIQFDIMSVIWLGAGVALCGWLALF